MRKTCTAVFLGLLGVAAFAQAPGIAQRPAVRDTLAFLERIEPETLDEQVRLCEIPAPPFEEKERAEYYRKKFVELGLQDVRIDREGNVHGVRPGRAAKPLLVFSAHLDTVFPPGTDTRVTRTGTLLKGPGIADDCRGLAVLLAVVRGLNEGKIATAGTVRFVGTVGEEGLGDLRGVRHLFEHELKGEITHFVSLDGTGLGAVDGAVGSNRYRVTFRSAGGHSYGSFGLVNPIHALGRAVEKIARFEVPENPKTTFNVGRIEGGTSVNSIAQAASFEIDLRSVSADELDRVDAKFRAAVDAAVREENLFWAERAKNPVARVTNRGSPITVEVESVGRRPTGKVNPDAPILQAVRRADAALGIKSSFGASSTDSNMPISLGIPAVTLRSGGDGTGNHALQEQFDSKDSHRGTQRAFLALLEIVGLAD
jgi:acetylornithine deacetylase/succinyl-diaminopimelate desuccinylase-like protein